VFRNAVRGLPAVSLRRLLHIGLRLRGMPLPSSKGTPSEPAAKKKLLETFRAEKELHLCKKIPEGWIKQKHDLFSNLYRPTQ